jgi:hypothetical protein
MMGEINKKMLTEYCQTVSILKTTLNQSFNFDTENDLGINGRKRKIILIIVGYSNQDQPFNITNNAEGAI